MVHSTGANVSVMVLQGCKFSPHDQKNRLLESGHRRHAVWIAIEYSYKLAKNEFKFMCELCTFLQIQSHLVFVLHTNRVDNVASLVVIKIQVATYIRICTYF